MDYRASIIEGLNTLQTNLIKDSQDWKELEELKQQAKAAEDPRILFGMYQSLREVIAAELTGKPAAPFKVKHPDGSVIEHETYEDALKQAKLRPTVKPGNLAKA